MGVPEHPSQGKKITDARRDRRIVEKESREKVMEPQNTNFWSNVVKFWELLHTLTR